MSQFQEQQPGAHPGMAPKHEDSFAKTVGKKYAAGAAKEAGKQTEDYVKDNHSELEQQAGQQYDDAKAKAQAELDNAKQTWAKIFPCCG